ncbi:MAG TPA: DMT family transporter [Anaerolineaceae bacterium]|nr:DMT family transporter [Anaerolineaceae bacterium]
MPTKRILPYIALLVGVLSLGISPFFVRWSHAPGPVTTFYRMAIAALVLTPFVLAKQAKDPVKITPRLVLFPALGGLSSTFDLILWSLSILHTKVANATLMGNVAPLWVALVAWLVFKERLRGLFWVGLGMAMAGASVIVGGDLLLHPQFSLGDLMGLGSSLFYAGYYLATQVGRVRLDTLRYIWGMDVACSLGLLTFTQIMGMPLTGYDPQTYLAFLGAGLTTQVIGYFSIAYALGHLPASVVSPTLIGQPVLSAILAIPLLGEHLSITQWVGGFTVLAGIYLVHRARTASPAETAARVSQETG